MADESAEEHAEDEPTPEPQAGAVRPTRRRLVAVIVCICVVGVLAGLQGRAWRLTRKAEGLLGDAKSSQALPLARQAARWAPWYGPAYIASGRAQVRGAPAAAIIDLSLGLTLAPRHGEDGYLALCQIADGPAASVSAKLAASARGLRWFPRSRYLTEYHAGALYSTRDYAGAYAQYRRALTLPGPRPISDQNRARLCVRLAECAHRLSKPLEAAGWYCQADALSGRDDPDVARQLVPELALAGDVAKAVKWNAETVRRDPSPGTTSLAVSLFAVAGRWDQAMDALAHVAQRRRLMPGEGELCLARAHNHVGRYEQALALAQESYAAAETGWGQAQAAVMIGNALVGMGRYTEAVIWLEKPGTARWGWEKYRALVKAYAAMGETAKKDAVAKELAKYSDMEKTVAALVDFARRNPVTTSAPVGLKPEP